MAEVQTAPATVEINDAIFCTHYKEVCSDCSFDGREENDSFFGLDPIDREGIECPASIVNKDGNYQCKKHGSTGTSLVPSICSSPPHPTRISPLIGLGCNQCYGWKKQINRARTAAKKAGRK
ncbi:uncharacterized protein LACBIDRAFT_299866 [Laccaria bicolor S238N-H82]|uniref:Predicted protein n=1 Tax=Laccaria bicolor (strain S238N-H82 / ATCC MYA-4686) TaxID=486041 RepID=B0DFL9_LACBS|nr:uncharacterized protein LACBIDRAFT_299866 [Laccaria bicolor S238N-H82]EDR06724.1 predicted protein [Laccaria bicolor S238N-H82]|eukprot:XP_001882571.1 predicted protein [Laccaria bicolor S238N-H82]